MGDGRVVGAVWGLGGAVVGDMSVSTRRPRSFGSAWLSCLRGMASFAATATQGQLDEVAGFPLFRAVDPYLDPGSLMPPLRLRWSRILGRPMMDRVTVVAYGGMAEVVGPVFIDEVAGQDCLVSGRHFDAGRRDFLTNVPAATLAGNRDRFWYMRLMDPLYQDAQFEFAWRARYGLHWPMIAPATVHPVLARLYERFVAFHGTWVDHVQEREDTTYRQRVEMLEEDTEDMSEEDMNDDMSD